MKAAWAENIKHKSMIKWACPWHHRCVPSPEMETEMLKVKAEVVSEQLDVPVTTPDL